MKTLGDNVMDLLPNHGGEDEGDVHVPGDSVNRLEMYTLLRSINAWVSQVDR